MRQKINIYFRVLQIKILNFWNTKICGKGLTEKGEAIMEYCKKIIFEDYQPQTMAEFCYEKDLHLEGLSREKRRYTASIAYMELAKYDPR